MLKGSSFFTRQRAVVLLTATLGLLSAQLSIAFIVPQGALSAREKPVTVQKGLRLAASETVSIQIKETLRQATDATNPALLTAVNQPDILPHHRHLADETLRTLPGTCANQLQNFYVRYTPFPERGLGGGKTIILAGNLPDAEFRALLIHECGHIVDTGALKGSTGDTGFKDGTKPIYADDPSIGFYAISWTSADTRKRESRKNHFVSGYAAHDIFEDFAETYTFYALHQPEFERLAKTNPTLKRKYEWMKQHVFAGSALPVISTHTQTTVPWDTTKLAYTWIEGQ